MARKHLGRKRGSRNKGYFYRTGRGWYTKEGGRFTPLTDENGNRLKDPDTKESVVKKAYARFLAAEKQAVARMLTGVTVQEVCEAYLANCKANDSPATFVMRSTSLFDFCSGFPGKYRDGRKRISADRIHDGFGGMLVDDLKPIHVDQWLQAHPGWNGSKRSHIQGLKRAFNYAAKQEMIPRNPIKGFKAPKGNGRVTYIEPEQEEAMIANTNKAFGEAIRILIRTGARPGIEFASLTAAHVTDHGDKMEWVFKAEEAKTGRKRIIYVTDPHVMVIVRRQIERHPAGPLFRNTRGNPWTMEGLRPSFDRVRRKLKKKGIALDKDACVYSFRHTYAKRCLDGYWTQKPISVETLSKLMGNSVEICREHYLAWDQRYTEQLWAAC